MSVTIAFTEAAAVEIAALPGVIAREEPYRVRGDALSRLELGNTTLTVAGGIDNGVGIAASSLEARRRATAPASLVPVAVDAPLTDE